MKWVWLLSAAFVVILVKGVASGGLSGPQDIPKYGLAGQRGGAEIQKLRMARPEIELAKVEQAEFEQRVASRAGPDLVSLAEPKPADAEWVEVTGNFVNVRMRPDLGSSAFTTYSRGMRLQLLRERGKWGLVLDPDTKTSGWMWNDYLSRVEPPQLADASGSEAIVQARQ